MATVSHYRYDFYLPQGFQPGEERGWSFGPWNWGGKALAWTVRPFNLSTSTRTMAVTSVRARSTPGPIAGQEYVEVYVRNLGPDPIVIWYLWLGIIEP
jgi:hypothetical protein